VSRFQLPNKAYIRGDDDKYYSALTAIESAINNSADQAGVDPTGIASPKPTPISAVTVVEKDGIHDIQIQDNSPAYNGIQYSAFYSRTPDMQNAHRIDLGESQNHRANLGAGTYYWGAASKYSASPLSDMVYHGGASPVGVGSGTHAGPPMQQAQGFTGPYRNSTVPPVRS
jgi:hypothetical protein